MTVEIGRLRERLGAVSPPWSVLVAAGVAALALALASRATTAEAAGLGAAPAAPSATALALDSRTAVDAASHLPVHGLLGAPAGALTHQVAAVTTTVAQLVEPATQVVTLPLSLPDPLGASTGAQPEAQTARSAPAPIRAGLAIAVAHGGTPSPVSVGATSPIPAPEAPMPAPTGPLPTVLSAVVGPVAAGGAVSGIAAGLLIVLTRAIVRPRPPTPIQQVELISRVERPG